MDWFFLWGGGSPKNECKKGFTLLKSSFKIANSVWFTSRDCKALKGVYTHSHKNTHMGLYKSTIQSSLLNVCAAIKLTHFESALAVFKLGAKSSEKFSITSKTKFKQAHAIKNNGEKKAIKTMNHDTDTLSMKMSMLIIAIVAGAL